MATDPTLALSVNQQAALGMHAADYARAYAAYCVYEQVHGQDGSVELMELGRMVRSCWQDLIDNMATMTHVPTTLAAQR